MRAAFVAVLLVSIAQAFGQGPPRQGPIKFAADDVPAFDAPEAGFDVVREDVPHGRVETMEYDSKTVGVAASSAETNAATADELCSANSHAPDFQE